MKGVSPLIATVMLVVIVVSMVALISTWLTQMITDSRETTSNRTDTAVGCSGASITIRSVYITPSGAGNASARAIVENDGLVDDMAITAAQLYNTTGHNFPTNTTLPVTSFTRGSIAAIVFNNVSLSSCADFSQVVVSSPCSSTKYSKKPTNC